MAVRRVLAIAAATGRIGYVYLEGNELKDRALSRKASQSPRLAAATAKAWIDQLRPEVVVTEKITERCRKGANTKSLIEAISTVAANEYLFDIAVERPRAVPNKYVEAAALAERFPPLRPWVPKPRKVWDSEPRSTTYFEALVLALQVIDQPSDPPRASTD